jgi:hypothetical protein
MGSFTSGQPYSTHAGNKKVNGAPCYKRSTYLLTYIL